MKNRKLIMYCIAVCALSAGLAFSHLDFIAKQYETFVYGLGALTTAAMAGNVGEHFARRSRGVEVIP